MVIPKQVSASGFVQMCFRWGLTDSYLPLILPGIAAPVVFFYMLQYMRSVLPMEVVDAARVDGSGEFSTFNRIVLPMIKPCPGGADDLLVCGILEQLFPPGPAAE